uniref:Decapping nuclease n=1 Tax=Strongyloides venezuelensis TaxID=75913 RepID=A0A0K0F2M2_STRVS
MDSIPYNEYFENSDAYYGYSMDYRRDKLNQVIIVLPVETKEFVETDYFDNSDKEPDSKRVKKNHFVVNWELLSMKKVIPISLHKLLCGISRDKFFILKKFIKKAIGIEIFPPTIVLNKLWFEIDDDSDLEYFNFITIKNNNQYIFVDTINDTDHSQFREIIGCYNTNIVDDLTSRYEHLVYTNKINTNQRVVDICITGDNCIYTKETLRKVASLIANQINNLKDLTVKPSKDHDKYTVKIRWFMISDFNFVHYVMGSKVNFNKNPCSYCTNFKGFNNIDKHMSLYWKTLDGEKIIRTLQAFQRIFSNIPLGELTKQNLDDYEWIINSIYNIQLLCLADELSDSQHT